MTMSSNNLPIDRRGLLALAIIGSIAGFPWPQASAQAPDEAAAAAPIGQLDQALLTAMKAGGSTPFDDRYRALAPVIEQVFDLDAVLAASVGLSWPTLPDAQKATLAAAFRRYTISSYATSFDSYNGQSFQVLPTVRAVGNGEVVVSSRLQRADGSSFALDYVMRRGQDGWRAVDVLTAGSISRVAVQRSDFRELLNSGGAPALVAGLDSKVANLSGGSLG
jgi:phospholipid transport system substrate-binding protein